MYSTTTIYFLSCLFATLFAIMATKDIVTANNVTEQICQRRSRLRSTFVWLHNVRKRCGNTIILYINMWKRVTWLKLLHVMGWLVFCSKLTLLTNTEMMHKVNKTPHVCKSRHAGSTRGVFAWNGTLMTFNVTIFVSPTVILLTSLSKKCSVKQLIRINILHGKRQQQEHTCLLHDLKVRYWNEN